MAGLARLLCTVAVLSAAATGALASERPFSVWLEGLRAEAIDRGISPRTVEVALAGVQPDPRILELDRNQPGAPQDFCSDLDQRVSRTRVERGRRMLEQHRQLLDAISREYGVPPRYLVAIWGLETNFGDYTGSFPVIASLVTLARDPRRSDLFREQVFAALRIVEGGHHGPDGMLGSWAGATGQVQLMPTTFLAYAVDHDGDGRKDVWNSLPDALASAAHYLRRSGWRSGESWGRPVRLPASLAGDPAALRKARSLAAWQQGGVRRLGGGDLPAADMSGSIVLPGATADPAFLVYRNYRTFLSWNRSTFYAISLGALADELGGIRSVPRCS